MRKVLLLVVLMLMASQVQAQEVKSIIDHVAVNQGVGYNLKNHAVDSISTADLISWKSLTLEGGVSGDSDASDWSMVAVASIKLVDLQGVIQFPILDKIVFRPGIYYSLGSINKGEGKPSYGISMSVLSLKF